MLIYARFAIRYAGGRDVWFENNTTAKSRQENELPNRGEIHKCLRYSGFAFTAAERVSDKPIAKDKP
jgi:hypothetical protein